MEKPTEETLIHNPKAGDGNNTWILSWFSNLWPSQQGTMDSNYQGTTTGKRRMSKPPSYKSRRNSDEPKEIKKFTIIDPLKDLHLVILSYWDNISGPNVEHVWKGSSGINPLTSAIGKMPSTQIIEDYVPSQNFSKANIESFANLELDNNTESEEVPQEHKSAKVFSSMTTLEVAEYMSKYILGGELVEAMSIPRGASKDYDPLNIFYSPYDQGTYSSSPGSGKLHFPSTPPNYSMSSMKMENKEHIRESILPKRLVDDFDEVTHTLNIEYKMHVFDEADYFTMSGIFTAWYREQDTRFALTFVFPKGALDIMSAINSMVIDRINQAIVLYTYFIQNKSPHQALRLITPHIKRLSEQIDRLIGIPGIPAFNLKSTLFSSDINWHLLFESNDTPLGMESKTFNEKIQFHKQTLENEQFLSLILTSHFQTHRRTIFVGEDINLINLYILTLALFISPEERKRSSLATKDSFYIPDVPIQGLTTSFERILSDEQVIQSIMPTTLVDLNRRLVFQTYPFHEYRVFRREYQKLVIQKSLKIQSKSNLWSTIPTLFQPVKQPAPCVRCMIVEANRLPEYLKIGFIKQSLNSLELRCYILIKYVEALAAESDRERSINTRTDGFEGSITHGSIPHTGSPTQGTTGHMSLMEASSATVAKRIKADLDLGDHCYAVLLGLSELIKPGIYRTLFGDPSSQEMKWIELFQI